jgi:hypothetical protein
MYKKFVSLLFVFAFLSVADIALGWEVFSILEASPAVSFDMPAGEGREDISLADIAVSLSLVSGQTITVDYNVTGGTAEGGGVDYTLESGSLQFDPCELTQYISIAVIEDDLDEDPDETIEITLSNPVNADLGTYWEHTFTILPPVTELCPAGDLDGDCDVDANDVYLFCEQWLDPSGSCSGFDCADFDGVNGIDACDYALFAGGWQQAVFPVVINEFMASNDSNLQDPCDGTYPDWIELYNGGPIPLDLGGLYLTDKLSEPTRWEIPAGVTIEAGGYLVFLADGETGQGPLHTSFGLKAADEDVGLFDTDGSTLIDGITFQDQVSDISYGRYPDASNNLRFFATPTPGSENTGAYLGEVADTKFSHHRGFYESAFTVSVVCNTGGAEIHYTLDGSEPNEFVADATYLYTGPLDINQTTVLRAAAFKPGHLPSNVDTQTYVYLDDVVNQPDMRSAVVNAYGRSVVKDALKSVPTLSIAMDANDLANLQLQDSGDGPSDPHPKQELSASAELIYADANQGQGFEINCGIEGHSSPLSKRSYRLIFKTEFGPSQLQYPFFESAPINAGSAVDEFDRIVLRAAKNFDVTYAGDQWTRDSQIGMCGIGAHGTFVHLYINGKYRGVYNATERPDAWFASSYFGGQREDYFATNHGIERGEDHISGDSTRFDAMLAMARERDLTDPNKYEQFKGLCDVQEFADYTVIFWFSGFDDNMDNNWYAGMRNVPLAGDVPPEGFMMFMWDAEFVFITSGDSNVPWVPDYYFDEEEGWTISDTWLGMFDNQDFRVLFADRVYKHCFNGGALTEANAQTRWNDIVDFVDEAGICEQARWGEGANPEIVDMNGFVDIFLTALRDWSDPCYPGVELYPDFDPPVFSQHGGYVAAGFGLTMINPDDGDIFYTLDGNDPREAVTGDVAGTEYTSPVTLNHSVRVKARVEDAEDWSALNEVVFAVGPVADNLRITEIMYHPKDANDPNDPNTEYIELKNIGPNTINLNLVSFTDGIDFTFGSVGLTAGQYVVVVKNESAFMSRYPSFGGTIAGEYTGRLNNGGEGIRLEDAVGQVIHDFEYKDGWRSITDGNGFSLTIIDATAGDVNSWCEQDSWRASVYVGGSPGADDSGILPNPGAVVINEVMSHSHGAAPDWIELYNTTVGAIDLGGWFLSDSDTNLAKYEIAAGTSIAAGGYMVFYEDVNFGDYNDVGCHVPFALSENGEEVVLSSYRDANSNLTGYRRVEDFGASESNVSFGRHYKFMTDTYNFVAMESNTPGLVNASPKVGPVVITEMMYHPDWPVGSLYDNEKYEYIELYNISGADVNLYDEDDIPWKFTDGIEFEFPSDANIPAGGYALVVKDADAFAWRLASDPNWSMPGGVEIFGPYDGKCSNGGEKIELSMPGDVDEFAVRQYIRIDRVNYSDGSHPDDCPGGADLWPTEPDGGGQSLSRLFPEFYGNDVDNWRAWAPSPGTVNLP